MAGWSVDREKNELKEVHTPWGHWLEGIGMQHHDMTLI